MSNPVWRRRFFDPAFCPECHSPVGERRPDLRCATCGLVLSGPTAEQLGATLAQADQVLTQLRHESMLLPRPMPGPGVVAALSGPQYAGFAPPLPARPHRQPISPSTVLLALGGLCVVVAVLVFIGVNWGNFSLGAKVAVLASITAALAAAAASVTRRGLRASAETLWLIAFVDLAIDLAAARAAGLAPFDAWSWAGFFIAFGVILGVCAIAVSRWSVTTRVHEPLVASQLVAGFSLPVAAVSIAAQLDPADWVAYSLVVVLAVASAGGMWFARLPIAALLPALTAGFAWVGLVGSGAESLTTPHYLDRLSHGDAFDLPAAAVIALALAAAAPKLYRAAQLPLAIGGFAVLAAIVGGIGYDTLPTEIFLAPAVILFALSFVEVTRNPWVDAARLVSAAVTLTGVAMVAFEAASGLGTMLYRVDVWRGRWQDDLVAPTRDLAQVWPSLGLLAVVACAVVAVVVVVELDRRVVALRVGSVTVPVAVSITMNALPHRWIAVAAWLLAAVVGSAIASYAKDKWLWGPSGLSLLAADLVALASPQLTLVTWLAAGAACAAAGSAGPAGRTLVGDTTARMLFDLTALAHLFVAVMAGGYLIEPAQSRPLVAGLLAVTGVAGAVSVISHQHRWWRWISGSASVLTCWVQAAEWNLSAVEPYSIPPGLLALAFGLVAIRGKPDQSSWATYAPGLMLLTSPSLFMALRDPVSLRAVLVGVWLLALLAFGASQRLQAPFAIGAVGGALLVLVEVWPYAVAVPRWVSIGLIGTVLLLVGVTWEQRRSELAQAQQAIDAMK